jgi:hypothetical protein
MKINYKKHVGQESVYGGSIKILAICKIDRCSIHIYLKAGCHVTEAHRQVMIPSIVIEVSHI